MDLPRLELLRVNLFFFLTLLILIAYFTVFNLTSPSGSLAVEEVLWLAFHLVDVFFCELSNLLSFFPDAHHRVTIFLGSKHTRAVLPTISPLACIDAAIWPLESPLPFLNVIDEISFVLTTIRPD